MVTLSDFLKMTLNMKNQDISGSVVYCIRIDSTIKFLTGDISGIYGCFLFNLVLEGEASLECNGKTVKIKSNDLFVYLPGTSVRVISTSDDYKALSLIVEEQAVYHSSVAGIFLQTLWHSMSEYDFKIYLPEKIFNRIFKMMEDCLDYLNSNHVFKRQSVYFTVSLIFADIIDYVAKAHGDPLPKSLNVHIVIRFFRLLMQNFKTQHDISFYASQLHISKTHLSRVIKNTTGKTVIEHINRMLIMEASWLLSSSDMHISEIAEELNFSDQASFCKFFKRYKTITPSSYRHKNIY